MSNAFEEHWLSAYLDNELSADERALVEHRLQTDPATRQLFDDLKRVRSLVATLPGWEGSDLKPSIGTSESGAIDLAPHAIQEPTDGKAVAPISDHQVEYSTSLAESRLRERENAAAAQTRRSMRWTTILAVAAGLATVMLGAPYIFRSRGPVTEIAQHTDSAPALGELESAAPQFEAMPSPEAADEVAGTDGETPAQTTVDDYFYRSAGQADKTAKEPNSSLAAPRDAEATAPGTRSPSEPMAREEREEKAAEGRPNGAAGQSDLKRPSRGGTAGSASVADSNDSMSRYGSASLHEAGAEPSPTPSSAPAAPSPSPAAPAAAAERALAMGGKPAEPLAPSMSRSDAAPNLESSVASRAAPAQQPSVPPVTRSSESSLALRDDAPLGAGLAASPATAPPVQSVPPQVVGARSEAWSDQEVQGAIDQVWYFVGAGAGEAVSSQPGGGAATYGLAPSANETLADGTAAKRRAAENYDFSQSASGKTPANEPVAANGAVPGGAARGPAAAASVGKPSTDSPAIGLARLPADQSAANWLEQLRQEHSLLPLQRRVESERVNRSRESTAAEALPQQRSAIAGETAKSEQGEAQTVVLFVSASEARQILQSLESKKQAAAKSKLDARRQAKDGGSAPAETAAETPAETVAPGELPPAWWKRPQVLHKKNTTGAKASRETDDEKVILILSQLPPG